MRLDAVEAIANALVGIVVSWAATWAVLGFTPAQSVGVTALFFGLSTTRQFLLRRLFRRWG